EALDQLGRLGADDVGAEQRAALGIEDRLHQPVRLAKSDRLAVGRIREAPDPDLASAFARRLLGEPDGCDLRRAVGAARDVGLVDGMDIIEAGDLLDADDALVARLVREPRRTDDVADGMEARHTRPAPFVDDDVALFDFDAL